MILETTPRRIGYIPFVFFFLLIPFIARAQNEVAIGSATTKANAILWLNGNGSQGLLLPVVANKSAISNPEKGMIVYDDSDNKIWYWNASAWVEASGGATGGGTVTTVSGTSPIVVANPSTTPAISLADGGVGNAKLANDAVTSAKILDATITGADISNATVSVDKLAQSSALTGQVLKWNGTNWVPQNDDAGPTLNNGELLIGNGTSNSAATLTGDATLAAGVLTITNGVISGGKIANATITNANIANAAAIDVSKLAIGSNGQVLTTVAGVPTWSAGSAGTVTSVAGGIGLTGGPITSTGILSVDVGLTAGKIVQLDGTAKLPAVDGSQLTGLNASNISAGLLPLDRITAGTAGDVLTTVAGLPTWQAPVTGVTTLDGLTDAVVAAPASGQVLVNDGAGQFRNVNMSGDATISSAGALTITNGAVAGGLGGKIADGTITTDDLAPGAVSGGVGGIIIDATVTNADISAAAAIAVAKVAAGANGDVLTTVAGTPTWQAPGVSSDNQDLTLAGTTLSLVNDVTPVVLGGLSILNNVTTTEITDATILNADISAAAAIAVAKVAAGVNGDVLTTVAGTPTWQAPAVSSDNQDLTLAGTTLSLVNDVTPVVLGGLSILNNVTTTEITDATILNADISAAAAIAVAKVAAGVNGDVLTTVAGTPTWQAPAVSPDNQDLTLAGTTLSLVNDVTPVVLGGLSILNNVTTTEITDATILNADISAAAAIAVTKVAGGANGEVLTTIAGVPSWQAPVGATALDGLTDAVVAAPASGQILVNDGAGQFRNVNMSGDAAISAAGALTIADGAISGGVGGKLADASVTAADLAAGSVSGGAGGILTDASVTNIDIAAAAGIAVTKVAAGVNGDVLTTVAGVPTWQAAVTGATSLDGLSDATVAAASSSQILVNDGAGQFRNVNMSGDATITTTGVLTIANGAISGGAGGKIADATITASDLAASSVSGGAAGIITDGTITTADITDGTITTTDIADLTITNTDISGSAAIAVTKVAAGADGTVLTTVGSVPTWTAPTGGFSTANVVPKGNGSTLESSLIYDDGSYVGINNVVPLHTLDIYGSLYQTYGYSFFNQSLSNTNGNMAIGASAYNNIKLRVESDQTYTAFFDNAANSTTTAFFRNTGSSSYAGFFQGDVHVNGTLSKSFGAFKIDHPLDPLNKFLYHSFVESPDMMNVYNGNVVTDGQGEVTITMPDYFEALNKDFRYQLTVMGTFAQAIVYKKMMNNSFVIKTDKPNVEVSWQVTGIRKDPVAEQNRLVPEVPKTGTQIGTYLNPTAYGVSASESNDAQSRTVAPNQKP